MKLKNVELRKRAGSNSAIECAKSALCNVRDNKARHLAVQDFMLANDEATIACEVPVYLAPWEVSGMDRPLSGHIDILQIRGDRVWILDYKPNARYNVQAYLTQVFLYGVCLSRRTEIPMEQIGLAYFDDRDYFEVNVLKQPKLI